MHLCLLKAVINDYVVICVCSEQACMGCEDLSENLIEEETPDLHMGETEASIEASAHKTSDLLQQPVTSVSPTQGTDN